MVRALAFSYKEQLAWVRWGRNNNSETFGIKNGTRQGSVGSPTFWSIYLNPLLKELRDKGVGCHIAGMFMGVCAFADVFVIMAPNRLAAQLMLNICEKYASENNIKFSTHIDPIKSKSKALFMTGQKKITDLPSPLLLCGKELPWVSQCEHLGHRLDTSGSMNADCSQKRAQFIDSSVKVQELFKFAHPSEVVNAVQKYCTSFYGSNLYDLRSETATQLYASWRTSIKLIWDLPRECHGYFLDSTLAKNSIPPQVCLLGRFVKFFHSLLSSPSPEVAVLCRLSARDIRTNIGSNLDSIRKETGLDPWIFGSRRIQEELRQNSVSQVVVKDKWRVPYLDKLLTVRTEHFYRGDIENYRDINSLISSLVKN